jgi:adenosylhomocysteine nucleosidase
MRCTSTWQRAGKTFFEGLLEGLTVVLSRADVGKVNSAITTQLLIDRGEVEAVIFTGVAGALVADLEIGELVIASGALYHDVDVTAFGYPLGQVPRLPKVFATDAFLNRELQLACTELGLQHRMGTIASGDSFISRPGQRETLAENFGALAVEMEGAAVAQTCYLNGIPFSLLRAISDRADGIAPDDFRAFSKRAAQRAAQVITRFCRRLSATG